MPEKRRQAKSADAPEKRRRAESADAPEKRRRAERADGIENRQRILAAATAVIARDGLHVPLATVAAEAGVGIGTMYRHFPHREALLDALVVRSLRLVVSIAADAAERAGTGAAAVEGYFHRVIECRDDLILPLRGGPALSGAEQTRLSDEIDAVLAGVLKRGRADGTIRRGVTSLDLIVMATMLAQPLPGIADWDAAARRTAAVYLAGLRPRG